MPLVAGQRNGRIKRGQVNDSYAIGAAVAVGQFNQLGLGLGIFEFDFVADQAYDAMRTGIVFGTDGQPHFGTFGSANQLDDFTEFHVHHVHR